MIKFKMEPTQEYERLVKFFIDNGLEFDEDEKDPSNVVVKCWKITQPEDYLIAACSLVNREGHFVVEGLAVEEIFRKFGLGKILMNKVYDEVKKQGGNEVILVARQPGFYEKLGFEEVAPEDAPKIFSCLGCPQFNVDCFPKVMKKAL